MRTDDPDDRPKRPVAHEVGCDLGAISVEELDERTALLEREIGRIRAERARKLASRDAAGAFFKT